MDRLRELVIKLWFAKPSSERQHKLGGGVLFMVLCGLLWWLSTYNEMLFFVAILFGVLGLYHLYRAIRPKKHQ